jgi:uncharacterized membrane protein HdeD (DUF308 family)
MVGDSDGNFGDTTMNHENQPNTSTNVSDPIAVVRHELQAIRSHWWWFLLLGIAMVVLGTIALGSPLMVSTVTVTLFGFLLLWGGVMQIIGSAWAGRWQGFLLHLMVGVLYAITGYLIVESSLESTVEMTRIVALFLLMSGVFRIVTAFTVRFHDWGWVLLNGVITLLMGFMILKHWPASGLWVIGMFVGIDMIFNGWSWIMLSLGLRASK